MLVRIRTAALCTVAACATVGLMTSSAQAFENLPHYGKCTAKAGGKYKNSGCTKLAKAALEQKFEWEPLTTTVKFTSAKAKETGNAVLESANGTEISCSGQTAKQGEFGPGDQVKNVVTEFAGCKALGAGCNSNGQPSEHVDTNQLHGEPGIVKKELKTEKNIDGHDLSSQSEFLAEFSCGPAPVMVRGGIVVKDQAKSTGGTTGETTNKMLNKRQVEFVGQKPGKQVPSEWTPNGGGITHSEHILTTEHLEGNVNGAGWEESAQTLITIESTSPTTVKVELRQCEGNGKLAIECKN